MKKLNTNNTGRMPFWQADLDWIQQAYTEPIKAIIKELGIDDDYFVVTGCQVTHDVDQLSMTAGWMWWDGELLPVRALEATNTVSIWLRLIRVTHSDPNGSRNFIKADQSTELVEDVWQDDYIQPVMMTQYSPNNEGAGVYIRTGARTLADLIKARIADAESVWQNTQSENSSDDVQFKRIGRMVVLKGTIIPRNIVPENYVEGLPVPLSGDVMLSTGSITHGILIRIDSQGRLNCFTSEGVTSCTVDGMMYMASERYNPSVSYNNPYVVEE